MHGKRALIALAAVALVASSVAIGVGAGSTGPQQTQPGQPPPQPGPPPPDHYLCYKAKAHEQPTNRLAFLKDQFGVESVVVSEAKLLCTPTAKTFAGKTTQVVDRDDHLKCYDVDEFPNHQFTPHQVVITNQFQRGAKLVVVKPDQLCLPTFKSKEPIEAPPANWTPRIDHFKCYRVAQSGPPPQVSVILQDQFGKVPARVRRARTLCAPVQKVVKANAFAANGQPPLINPATHLVCYDLKAPKLPKPVVYVFNQFGKETLKLDDAKRLCVPSSKQIPGTTGG